MPESSARLIASTPAPSVRYMSKRLPHPKARIETRAPVLPSTRVGMDFAAAPSEPSAAVASPARADFSRNSRLENRFDILTSAQLWIHTLVERPAARSEESRVG